MKLGHRRAMGDDGVFSEVSGSLGRFCRFCRRRPVLAYVLFAYAISWGYWSTLIVLGQRVGPGSMATHLPGLAGPMLAAMIVTRAGSGGAALRRLLLRCVRVPRPRWRSLMLALSPLAAGALLFLAMPLWGQPTPSVSRFAEYPGVPGTGSLPAVVALAFVLNGLGEEGGWRGFALRHLARGRSPLHAATAVGALWMTWHLPLFILNTSMSALVGPALLGWALGLMAGSIVLAWLVLQTRSIFVVATWHTAFNFMVATPPGRGLVAAALSTAVMVLAVAITRVWWQPARGRR